MGSYVRSILLASVGFTIAIALFNTSIRKRLARRAPGRRKPEDPPPTIM
ncbi:MAG: hypothetical protein JWN46_578 [Acidimicrobiales bacterium]|nr:hypothetical protein [Acidimicrobiales bacterium]